MDTPQASVSVTDPPRSAHEQSITSADTPTLSRALNVPRCAHCSGRMFDWHDDLPARCIACGRDGLPAPTTETALLLKRREIAHGGARYGLRHHR